MWQFITTLFALYCAFPLAAQDKPEGVSETIQLRGFAFSCFEGIERLELRHEENIVGTLDLPTHQLRNRTTVSSRSFSYGISTDGNFRPLGQTDLPADGKDFILVVASVKNGYKAFPVRTDDPDFRGNDTFLFNFTKYRLEILLGEATHQVKPWENAILRPSHAADATFYQARFSYDKDGTMTPFNNTRWPVNPNTKSLVFVSYDDDTDKLLFRSVTETALP